MAEYTLAQVNARIKDDPDMQDLVARNDETAFEAKKASIYEQFGYHPDGTPHSRAVKGINTVAGATGIPKEIVQGVANVPIPLATTFAGALAGSMAPGPGTLLGASVGSMAGEQINYQLGLRDKPSATDMGIAAVAPAIGPLVSRLKGPISNMLQATPGAGKHMHNIADDLIRRKAAMMETSDDTVEMMRQGFKSVQPFKTDVPAVRKHVADELTEASRSLTPDDAYIKRLNTLQKNLSNKKSFSFDELMATERDFIEKGAEQPTGVWKKLSGVLIKDLEEQAANPNLTPQTREKILRGAEAYKNYVAVNARHHGQKALDSFLHNSVTQLDDGLVRFNKTAFLKQLDKDGMKVFEPTELADMKKSIQNLGYIGAAPKSVMSGAVHTGSYGAAGLAAYSAGGVKGVVTLALAMGALKLALSNERGRRVIEYLAKNGHGKINGAELHSIVGKMVAGANAGVVAGVSGMGESQQINMPMEQ